MSNEKSEAGPATAGAGGVAARGERLAPAGAAALRYLRDSSRGAGRASISARRGGASKVKSLVGPAGFPKRGRGWAGRRGGTAGAWRWAWGRAGRLVFDAGRGRLLGRFLRARGGRWRSGLRGRATGLRADGGGSVSKSKSPAMSESLRRSGPSRWYRMPVAGEREVDWARRRIMRSCPLPLPNPTSTGSSAFARAGCCPSAGGRPGPGCPADRRQRRRKALGTPWSDRGPDPLPVDQAAPGTFHGLPRAVPHHVPAR